MADDYDITGRIGPLYPELYVNNPAEWPMYSFAGPSTILWNSLGSGLSELGWSDDKIRDWLQSKSARWALDSDLGEMLARIGKAYAKKVHVGG